MIDVIMFFCFLWMTFYIFGIDDLIELHVKKLRKEIKKKQKKRGEEG